MENNLLDRTSEELLTDIVSNGGDELLFANPSEATLGDLVTVLSAGEDRPTVKVLATPETFKSVMDDFVIASNAADMIVAGDLVFRESEDVGTNPLVVSSTSVLTIVTTGGSVGGLATDEESFVETIRSEYDGRWEDADDHTLRTPPLSQVNDGLAETISDDAEQDFQTMLGSVETARGDDDLDEVTLSLLVAAKNEALLYDISKWGEETGVASKATFSRTKTMLEERGLIETEKVPIDVGRPRLRLTLSDERLQSAGSDQLVSVAQSLLT